jgi:hypothetical protein
MAGVNINTKKIGKAVYYLRIRRRILAEIDRLRAYTRPDYRQIQWQMDRYGGYLVPQPMIRLLIWRSVAQSLNIRLSRREWRQVMR